MLLFDGYDTTFRCIKLRKKKLDCDVCGITPKVRNLIDYEQFCGSAANDSVKTYFFAFYCYAQLFDLYFFFPLESVDVLIG